MEISFLGFSCFSSVFCISVPLSPFAYLFSVHYKNRTQSSRQFYVRTFCMPPLSSEAAAFCFHPCARASPNRLAHFTRSFLAFSFIRYESNRICVSNFIFYMGHGWCHSFDTWAKCRQCGPMTAWFCTYFSYVLCVDGNPSDLLAHSISPPPQQTSTNVRKPW